MNGLPAPPILHEGTNQALHLESALQDLPLYSFQMELGRSGWELAQVFEQHPALPGAVLTNQGQFVGIISRRQLLEYLLRPHGVELFLKQPLYVLHSYARCEILRLPGSMPIVAAAHQALRRSPDFLGEPVVVELAPQVHHLLDTHALNIAYWQIRGIETQVRYERSQAQMIQSDKMASLGRLVDGVAHEILDPVSFIWGNLSHVSAYCQNLLEVLAAYEQHLPDPPAAIAQLKQELELDYLRQDLPQTIDSIRTGAERLSKLATSLQNFCHIDEVYPRPANLHEILDGILLLLKSRLTSEIQIVKHYGHLPPIPCFAGQLNQVFMNILSHAVNALINQAVSQQLDLDMNARRQGGNQPESGFKPAIKPTIEITTQIRSIPTPTGKISRWVSICFADNGPGLSPETQQRILESFSVKRRTENETSLAMSYQIVTAKHGGKLEVRSRASSTPSDPASASTADPSQIEDTQIKNTGTEFEVLLPLT